MPFLLALEFYRILILIRGYSQKKISENIECEIMQVLLDEAKESYKPEIVLELVSETVEQMAQNLDKLSEWVEHRVNIP
mgnify:FL=1